LDSAIQDAVPWGELGWTTTQHRIQPRARTWTNSWRATNSSDKFSYMKQKKLILRWLWFP